MPEMERWWRMARVNQTMRKLQAALICAGKRVKINTRQFYSKDQGRMITSYFVILPQWSNEEKKMVDRELLKTCSTVEVVKFLADMLEGLRNGTEP
jgi:hypothetical protein